MNTTYTINPDTSALINTLKAELRLEGKKDLALSITKVYGNIKKHTFNGTTVKDVLASYTGKVVSGLAASVAIGIMLNVLIFDEVEVSPELSVEVVETETTSVDEDIVVPEIQVDTSYQSRYSFINTMDYSEMTAQQLTLVLFKELGQELEAKITSMQTGSKVKLDMLDELKSHLVNLYPEVRIEKLEEKLANALAVTKLKAGTSLAVVDGNLAVYGHMNTGLTLDSSNFEFMATIGGDTTKALDILILQSAFKTYKEEVSNGNLPMTSNELNLAISKTVTGVEPVKKSSLEAIKNLF